MFALPALTIITARLSRECLTHELGGRDEITGIPNGHETLERFFTCTRNVLFHLMDILSL